MKQWGFKEEVKTRWKLLKGGTVYSLRESLAYSGNNWGALISTVVYIITFLVFIDAMFQKYSNIAGYSYGEVLFLNLITQFSFLGSWFGSMANIETLNQMVRSGDLDLILVKPLPHLWYVTFKKIDLVGVVLNIAASIVPILFLLPKHPLGILRTADVLKGIFIMMCGFVIIHCFQFIVNLLVFWNGQGKNLFRFSYELSFFGDTIPYEGFPLLFKVIGITLIPCLITTGLTTSVMLGKTNNPWLLPFVGVMAFVFIYLKGVCWKEAIRHYQSASS